MSPQPPNPKGEGIEPIIFLLTGLVVFFVSLLIAISKWSPNDGQTFQVISGLLATFSGVLAGRITPKSSKNSTSLQGNGNGDGGNPSPSSPPPDAPPAAPPVVRAGFGTTATTPSINPVNPTT